MSPWPSHHRTAVFVDGQMKWGVTWECCRDTQLDWSKLRAPKIKDPNQCTCWLQFGIKKKQNPTTAAAWQRPLTSTHRTAFPLWLLYQNANMIGKFYHVLPSQRKPLYPGHSSVLCPIVGLVVPGYTYLASGGEPFTRTELLWFKETIFRSTFSTIQKYIYLSFPYFLLKQRFVSK